MTKRLRRPEWTGARFGVFVKDGNSENWLQHFSTCPLGAVTISHEDMTPEIVEAMVEALESAIESLRKLHPYPSGGGEVVPFRRMKKGRPEGTAL